MRLSYFAYGSNMSADQMGAWCSDHVAVGPARLDGFRLAFLRDSPRWLAGAADIVPAPRRHLWGVLYEVSSSDLGALDRKENSSGILGYRRRAVDVHPDGGRGRQRAITYVVIQRTSRELPPSPDYLELLVSGGLSHGLPKSYLELLRSEAERLKRP